MSIKKTLGIFTISVLAASSALAKGHLPAPANPPAFADHVTAAAGAGAAESDKGASDKAKELRGLGNSKDEVVPAE